MLFRFRILMVALFLFKGLIAHSQNMPQMAIIRDVSIHEDINGIIDKIDRSKLDVICIIAPQEGLIDLNL